MRVFIAKHSPLFILAGLCIALAVMSDEFGRMGNLQSVAGRTSEIGIMAAGELLVILTAGIDLSVGSVAALGGVMCGLAIKGVHAATQNDTLAILAGILAGSGAGLACGLINGSLITLGRIPPFIVTLGMMMMARGATLLLSGGEPVFGLPEGFLWIGGAKAWWVPCAITVGIVLLLSVVLHFTRFGRALYAIGGNLQAARLSGLPVNAYRAAAYTISGTLAGFTGVILASRTSVAAPMAAEMYELQAIAACVIGGASLMGGEGGSVFALAGALIMVVLQNYCNLENINVYWQQILVGGLIIGLVFYDNYRKRKVGLLSD